MRIVHRSVAAAVAVLLMSGCTGQTPESPASPLQPTDMATVTPSGSPEPSPSTSPSSPTPKPSESGVATGKPTKKPTAKPNDPSPLPKVQRSGSASKPTVSATPAEIKGKVTYGDGVVLRIADIEFGEETKEGPGRFPGRAYAILSRSPTAARRPSIWTRPSSRCSTRRISRSLRYTSKRPKSPTSPAK